MPRIDVLTIFPALFEPFFDASIVGSARAAGRVELAAAEKQADGVIVIATAVLMACLSTISALAAVFAEYLKYDFFKQIF